MSDRIDISEPIAELCARLGLTPSDVKEIKFRPDTVYATVYTRTETGGVAIIQEHPVTHTHRFKVRT